MGNQGLGWEPHSWGSWGALAHPGPCVEARRGCAQIPSRTRPGRSWVGAGAPEGHRAQRLRAWLKGHRPLEAATPRCQRPWASCRKDKADGGRRAQGLSGRHGLKLQAPPPREDEPGGWATRPTGPRGSQPAGPETPGSAWSLVSLGGQVAGAWVPLVPEPLRRGLSWARAGAEALSPEQMLR